MFGMPGGVEWIIILVIALLIFGKRLPEVMKSMGKGIVEFKKGVKGVEEDVEEVVEQKQEKLESMNTTKFTQTDTKDEIKNTNEMKG
ncbi:MAG: twin-arginine translocase TatA/TatE family subunit [Planctomycetes bacterium]|nr:twin-arginine translocase TatA/TatE family subunit [Planctomycetota bacterium]